MERKDNGFEDTPGTHPLEGIVGRVYQDLRALADRMMRRQRSSHTLQATALVHEAYIRLASTDGAAAPAPADFIRLAAATMRSVLVDHARRRKAAKRGDGRDRVPLGDPADDGSVPSDLLAIDEALERLARLDARKSTIIELRFFAGLSAQETADVLGISLATLKRDWALAKAWLHREIHAGDDGDD